MEFAMIIRYLVSVACYCHASNLKANGVILRRKTSIFLTSDRHACAVL